MLSSLTTREVETSGVLESRVFTMKASGKSFKIVIDGLYSDKIGSMVREISTNAFDAHIAAGCSDTPFDMHLPTTYEPWFSVRDYGTSMSHDTVMDIYSTVFESTKDQNNEQVGSLGLGSKSPFAYADSFTVVTYLDGTRRTYSVYLGADHVPRVDLLAVEPDAVSDRGTLVSIPARPNDVYSFRTKARRLLHGFPVLPNQTGAPCDVERPEVVQDGAGWRWLRGGSGSCAHMGCVIYPIDASMVQNANQAQIDLMNNSFAFDFNIGDLEVAASREGLSYDERTSANILEAVDRAFAELIRRLTQQVNAAPTLWDAYIQFNTATSFGFGSEMRKLITQHVTWRGHNIYTSRSINPAIDVARGEVAVTHVSWADAKKVKPFKWEATTRVHVTPGEVLVFLDDKTKFTSAVAARIKYYMVTKGICKDILWVKADPKSIGFKRFYVKLGRPAVIDVSALDKPPAESRGYARNPVPMRKLGKYSSLEIADIDPEDGGVYFELERGEPRAANGMSMTSLSVVKEVRELLIAAGVLQATDAIIGVPATHKRMPIRNDGWTTIWQLARNYLAANPVDLQCVAEFEAANAFLRTDRQRLNLWTTAHTEQIAFTHNSFAMNELMTVARAHKCVEENRKMHELFRLHHVLTNDYPVLPPATAAYSLMKDNIFDAVYPLIPLVLTQRRTINQEQALQIVHYVNLVDAENERASSENVQQSEAA